MKIYATCTTTLYRDSQAAVEAVAESTSVLVYIRSNTTSLTVLWVGRSWSRRSS